mmetsp:Transcript_137427/g.293696  ORF Transcript_137427/g.293696 Transcript_137427/m.293696 type:complete len:220 (-) Transcript_137427:185-844(-)
MSNMVKEDVFEEMLQPQLRDSALALYGRSWCEMGQEADKERQTLKSVASSETTSEGGPSEPSTWAEPAEHGDLSSLQVAAVVLVAADAALLSAGDRGSKPPDRSWQLRSQRSAADGGPTAFFASAPRRPPAQVEGGARAGQQVLGSCDLFKEARLADGMGASFRGALMRRAPTTSAVVPPIQDLGASAVESPENMDNLYAEVTSWLSSPSCREPLPEPP